MRLQTLEVAGTVSAGGGPLAVGQGLARLALGEVTLHLLEQRGAALAEAVMEIGQRAVQAGELDRVQRALTDLREQFGGTTYAAQGGLLAAQALAQGGKTDEAQAALRVVADKASDEGYQAVARLRLAGLLADAKSYDEALAQLAGKMPPQFAGLVADRRGDILLLQGKKAEARAEYQKALPALDERAEYRRIVEVKLASLGGDPKASQPAAAASGAAK